MRCGLNGRSIAEVSSRPINELIPFFRSLPVEPGLEKVVSPPVAEIVGRLDCLVEVGLEYLTLDRGSDTLSGGELQLRGWRHSSARAWSGCARFSMSRRRGCTRAIRRG